MSLLNGFTKSNNIYSALVPCLFYAILTNSFFIYNKINKLN
jgi:hypothetical protein